MGLVTDVGGRTLLLYPALQIVVAMFAWVTRGSASPGVHRASGSPSWATQAADSPTASAVPTVAKVAAVPVGAGRLAGIRGAAEQASSNMQAPTTAAWSDRWGAFIAQSTRTVSA